MWWSCPPIGADQAENFSALHVKGNSAHGFEIAVAFREGSNTNGSIRRNAEVREEIFPLWSGRVHCAAR